MNSAHTSHSLVHFDVAVDLRKPGQGSSTCHSISGFSYRLSIAPGVAGMPWKQRVFLPIRALLRFDLRLLGIAQGL